MPPQRRLTAPEKTRIIQGLAEGLSLVHLAKELGRDARTLKSFTQNPTTKARRDKGTRRSISKRDLRNIGRVVKKGYHTTSGSIFRLAGVNSVSKTTRCRILKDVARHLKPIPRPPLTKLHKEKRLAWAKKYLKTDFNNVLFTDECRATVDGPDGWSKVWVSNGAQTPFRIRRQQGGGGVMFWSGIIGEDLLGPFKVPEGLKITSKTYTEFLKDNLEPWLDDLPLSRWRKLIFMQDNATSHSAKNTTAYLGTIGIKDDKLMTWPPSSPDLNPIEQFWSILKRGIYEDGVQYSSKEALWKKIQAVSKSIKPDEIRKLTSSMDDRLFKVISKHGSYVDK